MKNLFLIIATAFLCVSCVKYTPFALSVDNRTNDTIRIGFIEESPYSTIPIDSLVFPPQRFRILYMGNHALRPSENGCDYTGILKDQVEVEVYSGKVLTKEIWDVSNWDCVGSNYKNSWVQTFVIEEEDLE